MAYELNNNYLELLSGVDNMTSKVYREAANDVEKDTNKGLTYLKNFLTNIESLNEKKSVADKRISESKGNIKEFSKYDSVKFAVEFLNKNLGSLQQTKECTKVFDALENWAPLYSQAYAKNVRVIVLEYENAVYLLSTSLASILATKMEVVANGTELKITPKANATHGVIDKTMSDLAKQFSDRNHKTYLESMIQAAEKDYTESVYTEEVAAVVATVGTSLSLITGIFKNGIKILSKGVSAVKTIKRSLFGILPIIRSVLYLRYKKKADTIAKLEESVFFIQQNIEQLQNMKNMDPEKKALIIKKQQAYAISYQKKAEKLRAQLMEGEKEASLEAKKDEPVLKSDDEMVLEAAIFSDDNAE